MVLTKQFLLGLRRNLQIISIDVADADNVSLSPDTEGICAGLNAAAAYCGTCAYLFPDAEPQTPVQS